MQNESVVSQRFLVAQRCLQRIDGEMVLLKYFSVDVLNDENRSYYERRFGELIPYTAAAFFSIDDDLADVVEKRRQLTGTWFSDLGDQMIYQQFVKSSATVLCCEHQQATALVQCSYCGQFFGCRKCHLADHSFSFSGIVKCAECACVQGFCLQCGNCAAQFGRGCRKCGILTLFDGDFFHCDDCDACVKLARRENYLHCQSCRRCVHHTAFDQHFCMAEPPACPPPAHAHINETHCSVCLNTLASGRVAVLACGHALHERCYQRVVFASNECPLCRRPAANGGYVEVLKSAKSRLYEQYVGSSRVGRFLRVYCTVCRREFLHRDRNAYFCATCGLFNVLPIGPCDPGPEAEEQYARQAGNREPVYIKALQVKARLTEYFPDFEASARRDAVDELLQRLRIAHDDELVATLDARTLPEHLDDVFSSLEAIVREARETTKEAQRAMRMAGKAANVNEETSPQ